MVFNWRVPQRLGYQLNVNMARLKPAVIKTELENIFSQATLIEPALAKRLKDLMGWIGKRKDGFNGKPMS